jgi:hypothetical protein
MLSPAKPIGVTAAAVSHWKSDVTIAADWYFNCKTSMTSIPLPRSVLVIADFVLSDLPRHCIGRHCFEGSWILDGSMRARVGSRLAARVFDLFVWPGRQLA